MKYSGISMASEGEMKTARSKAADQDHEGLECEHQRGVRAAVLVLVPACDEHERHEARARGS